MTAFEIDKSSVNHGDRTAPACRLRPAARATATCAACGQPMVPLGHDTHPCCDPVYGFAPYGGGGRQRQLRLIEGGAR